MKITMIALLLAMGVSPIVTIQSAPLPSGVTLTQAALQLAKGVIIYV